MRGLLKSLLVGCVGAVIGTALVLLVLHVWDDHQSLHVLIGYINQHAAAINKLPAP